MAIAHILHPSNTSLLNLPRTIFQKLEFWLNTLKNKLAFWPKS